MGRDFGGERPPFSKPASAAVTDQGVRTVGANVPLSRPAKASGRASRAFGARAPEAGRGRPWFDPAVNDLLLLDFGGERPPAVAGRGRRDRPKFDEAVNALLKARGRTSPLEAGLRGRAGLERKPYYGLSQPA